MNSSNTSAQQKEDKHDNHNDHYRPNTDIHGLVPPLMPGTTLAAFRAWSGRELNDLLAEYAVVSAARAGGHLATRQGRPETPPPPWPGQFSWEHRTRSTRASLITIWPGPVFAASRERWWSAGFAIFYIGQFSPGISSRSVAEVSCAPSAGCL